MLRLGIVGCGRVTTMFHLKAIEEVEEVTVAAVADRDRGRMEQVKVKSGAERGYNDYRGLLADLEVEAVAVNTPPRFHEEMTLEALRSSKHVLCEKPIAQSVEGCLNIGEAERETGLTVLPVHNYAFTPCLETAKEIIQSGEIGKIGRVELRFNNNLWSYRSRTDFRMEERFGIVEDVLPHVLSVAQAMAGPADGVEEAKGWMKSYEVVDNLSLLMRTEDGVELDCSMNWTSLIPSFNVGVVGDSGRMDMELMKRPFRVSVESPIGKRKIDRKGLGKYLDIMRLKHPAFREQYRHFVRVIEGSEPPRFTVGDEVSMRRVMDEVSRRLSETDITQGSQ